MNLIVSMMAVLVSSAVIENLLFARAIGADHILRQTRSYRFIIEFGLGAAVISGVTVMPLWWLSQTFGRESWWNYARSMAAVLLIAVVSLLLTIAMAAAGRIQRPMRLVDQGAVYSASLAIVLLSLTAKMAFLPSVLYCFGASAGLAAAMILVHAGRERLELCVLPRSFEGLPITMIYIGILSLAIYGLIGHQLPT